MKTEPKFMCLDLALGRDRTVIAEFEGRDLKRLEAGSTAEQRAFVDSISQPVTLAQVAARHRVWPWPARNCCSNCQGTEFGMTKVQGRWLCDPCNRFELESDDMDIEGYEERRRQRLAEAEES
ncbi:hypothetical protein D3C84_855190 [compost metagenome]